MFRLIFRLKHSKISSVKFNSKFFFSSSYSFGALATFALVRLLSLSLFLFLSLSLLHAQTRTQTCTPAQGRTLTHTLARTIPPSFPHSISFYRQKFLHPVIFEKGPLLFLLPSLPLSYPLLSLPLSQPHFPSLTLSHSPTTLSHPFSAAYPQLSPSPKPNFFLTFKPRRTSLELLLTCCCSFQEMEEREAAAAKAPRVSEG